MTRSSVGDERRARGSERARLLDADDVEIASGREGGDGGDDGTTRAFRGRVAIVGALGALALVSLGVSAASASGGVSSATSALGDAYRAPWEREAWLGGTGNATASALGAHARGVGWANSFFKRRGSSRRCVTRCRGLRALSNGRNRSSVTAVAWRIIFGFVGAL